MAGLPPRWRFLEETERGGQSEFLGRNGMKAFDLSAKTVLVTGGNRGIGLGMAQGLAEAGATVVIWGSSAANNATALEQLRAVHGRVHALTVNVADEAAVVAAMQDTVAITGRLDCAISNAGIGSGKTGVKPFVKQSSADLQEMVDINLKGSFAVLREAAAHMVARAKAGDPGGSLVGLTSVGMVRGMAYLEPYTATKGAIPAMVRAVAMELGRYGIRANSIMPGFIHTDMTERMRDNDALNTEIVGKIPAQRWGTPEDFAGIAVYLASDASRYHSGDTLVVDGGYLAQ
jgi:NAD(P)-dependent dehydrogenase (short-subunit alcohol dehydrogenase family)